MNANIINPDNFLTAVTNFNCYSLNSNNGLSKTVLKNEIDLIKTNKQNQPIFCHAKLPIFDLESAKVLSDGGFYIVDVNVSFRKTVGELSAKKTSDIKVREATYADEERVVELASMAYQFSRFHADKNIGLSLANTIKGAWTRNFFRGKRGHLLLIAEIDNTLAGYLLIIKSSPSLMVIDLIAVSEQFRGRNVAGELIRNATELCGADVEWQVGTQVGNYSAINLYEKMGFRLYRSEFVYHFFERGK